MRSRRIRAAFLNALLPAMLAGVSVVSVALVAMTAAVAQITPGNRIPGLAMEEAVYESELQASAPQAIALLRSGTAFMDTGHYQDAATALQQVTAAADAFDVGHRRLGLALVCSGDRTGGLIEMERAVTLRRSSRNLGMLATALAVPQLACPVPAVGSAAATAAPEITAGTADQKRRALQLADEASSIATTREEGHAWLTLGADLAVHLQDLPSLDRMSGRLRIEHPNEASSHTYAALAAKVHGDSLALTESLVQAERLGADPTWIARLRGDGTSSRDATTTTGSRQLPEWGGTLLLALICWLCIVGIITVRGQSLSRRTMQWIGVSEPGVTGEVVAWRKGYRRIIALAAIAYYLSVPMVVLATLAFLGALMSVSTAIGWLPSKLLFLVIAIAATFAFFALRSLLVRPKVADPGRVLQPDEAPGLFDLLERVAEALGTRPVDEVRVVPTTDLALYERGSFRRKLSERGERVLVLGVANLAGLSQVELQSILAHEYGHVTSHDTAGGNLAFAVRRDLEKALKATATRDAQGNPRPNPLNLGHLFLRAYASLFRRIIGGATRLQEVMADRAAVRVFGIDAFKAGIAHMLRRSVEFEMQASEEIARARQLGTPVVNLFGAHHWDDDELETIDERVALKMYRPTTDLDSHPAPADRIRLVHGVRSESMTGAPGEAWTLFANPVELMIEMTSLLAAWNEVGVATPSSNRVKPALA